MSLKKLIARCALVIDASIDISVGNTFKNPTGIFQLCMRYRTNDYKNNYKKCIATFQKITYLALSSA